MNWRDTYGERDYTPNPLEKAEKLAKEWGLVVYAVQEDELFCDLDTLESLERFEVTCKALVNKGIIGSYRVTDSKKGHWHGFAKTLEYMDFHERVAYQCVMGSDLDRELYNLMAYELDDEAKIVAFELPGSEVLPKVKEKSTKRDKTSPITEDDVPF
jgi:hypothetical protein